MLDPVTAAEFLGGHLCADGRCFSGGAHKTSDQLYGASFALIPSCGPRVSNEPREAGHLTLVCEASQGLQG
eukprot:397757-Rhodomonas_salina.3